MDSKDQGGAPPKQTERKVEPQQIQDGIGADGTGALNSGGQMGGASMPRQHRQRLDPEERAKILNAYSGSLISDAAKKKPGDGKSDYWDI